MFAYKTNSPDYLDYVASTLTREQIKADPDLCLLLENPYIKDNMEIAIRWNAAKYGDYQDKYDFAEYLMCNGTELDADTILHYRAKAASDPVIMEIAYSYLSDVDTLVKIRKEKYNKPVDDCFNNPCFYLGKFSAVMGSCGDVKSTYTPFNNLANWINGAVTHEQKAKAKAEAQLRQGIITQDEANRMIKEGKALDEKEKQEEERENATDAVVGSGKKVRPTTKTVPSGEKLSSVGAVGGGRSCFQGGVIPSMEKGWNMMMAQIFEGNGEFTKELINSTNCVLNAQRVGDWMATPMAEMIDLVSKANVRRQLGDCARLWSQVRRLKLFGSENSYGPITADQLVGDTNSDGTPMNPIKNPAPTAADASKTVAASKKALNTVKTKKKKLKQRKTRSDNPNATVVKNSAGREVNLVKTDDSKSYNKALENAKSSALTLGADPNFTIGL